ncbi:MAG: aminotransferase class IV [Bacteroidia bacterium]
MTQIIYNGKLTSSDEVHFSTGNRAFRYGDGVFETIRIIGGEVCFPQRHLERLMAGVQQLRLKLPAGFITLSLAEWGRKLAQANNAKSGRIRLSVFRTDGGNYQPVSNDAAWLMEYEPLETQSYQFNENGLTIDLYQELRKPINTLSNIKSSNAIMYVLAAVHARDQQLDDCILLNHHGNVIEATASNLFAVKNGVLYTCPLTEGCVAGVMRAEVMALAQANRIAVYEVPLPMSVLLNSDEVFLTNAVRGIQWVSTYRQKRYTNETSKRLFGLLSSTLKNNSLKEV